MAKKAKKFFKDNSLSIAFAALFLGSLIAQSFTGWSSYNSQQKEHHLPTVSFSQFLQTGTFLDGMFVNWEAALLQLGTLIIFGSVLFQRGASHSRKPEHDNHKKRSRRRSWFYCNSLSLAFMTLFLIAFVLHIVFGTDAYNEQRATENLPPVGIGQYFWSSRCWFLAFQTWQAEFFAIVVFLILTIFLRQENSAESKPTDAGNKTTGEPNE